MLSNSYNQTYGWISQSLTNIIVLFDPIMILYFLAEQYQINFQFYIFDFLYLFATRLSYSVSPFVLNVINFFYLLIPPVPQCNLCVTPVKCTTADNCTYNQEPSFRMRRSVDSERCPC